MGKEIFMAIEDLKTVANFAAPGLGSAGSIDGAPTTLGGVYAATERGYFIHPLWT